MKGRKSRVNRRTFLAGSGAAAAGLAAAASAAGEAQRPWRIDCQSHLFAPAMIERLEARKSDPLVYLKDGERYVRMGDWHRRVLPNHMDVAAKLRSMDENLIEKTALSINDPGPEWFGDEGPEAAREANDFVAGVVARHPDRFFGLCVLPLLDMPRALAELDRAAGELGMKGILLYTNLAGRFPDEREFRPLFARACDLDLPILLHPALPVTASVVKGYEMISGLGNMFDNTIALARIVMSGLLDEFPRLKLVCPHLGGTLPYIVGRLDHQTQVLKRGPRYLKKAPSEYLKQVWFDMVSPSPLAMRFMVDFAGPERLLFASDHPWVDPALILGHFDSLALPAESREAILSQNARRLFNLPRG